MKYLGVDFGSKRVGLAFSDDSNSFAFPLSVLQNNEKLLGEVEKICKEKDIETIVVGESKDFSMVDNDIMLEVKPFVDELLKKGFNVVTHPEFMTSQEAERLQGKNDMLDASAAAIILKSYLDKIKNNGK